MLALAAALAAATFVKAFGVAFLGVARSRHASHAREVDIGMRAAMALLAALCVLFGILPSVVIDAIDAVPQMLLGATPVAATAQGWLWLTPISPRIASYSAPLLLAGIVVVGGLVYLLLRVRAHAIRRGSPWDCGFGSLNARMQYTGTAFSMPIQRVFAPAWDLKEEIEETRDPRQPLATLAIRHQLQAQDRSWSRMYEPIARLVLAGARRIGQLRVLPTPVSVPVMNQPLIKARGSRYAQRGEKTYS